MTLEILVEVAGCPTTCMHCWALGGDYGSMRIDDAAFAIGELARFCGERGLDYYAYPMHEVTAHPDAPDVIRLFAPHLGEPYDPMLTPGTPLASRDDWAEVVAAAKECGARSLHVAFHGYGAEHDRQLHRPGAFEETCLAVRRAQESGLGTGANVFLTKPALREFDRLLDTLLELGLGGMSIAPAVFMPTSRGRLYEELRPELGDLEAIADRVLATTDSESEIWSDLGSYTEGAWHRRALAGEWPARNRVDPWRLVVRPNLDLFTGTTGVYRVRHGNLRRDGAAAVLERALAAGHVSAEGLYFGADGPSSSDLAVRHGDAAGRRVYFEADSIRYRWLDRDLGGLR